MKAFGGRGILTIPFFLLLIAFRVLLYSKDIRNSMILLDSNHVLKTWSQLKIPFRIIDK